MYVPIVSDLYDLKEVVKEIVNACLCIHPNTMTMKDEDQ